MRQFEEMIIQMKNDKNVPKEFRDKMDQTLHILGDENRVVQTRIGSVRRNGTVKIAVAVAACLLGVMVLMGRRYEGDDSSRESFAEIDNAQTDTPWNQGVEKADNGTLTKIKNSFYLVAYAQGDDTFAKENDAVVIFTDQALSNFGYEYTGVCFHVEGENIASVKYSVDRYELFRSTQMEIDRTRINEMTLHTDTERHFLYRLEGVLYDNFCERLGSSVQEEYDAQKKYGFFLPEEVLTSEAGDPKEAFHRNIDAFDNAQLTVEVTFLDGTSERKCYRLKAGKIKKTKDESGATVLLKEFADDGEPYMYGLLGFEE